MTKQLDKVVLNSIQMACMWEDYAKVMAYSKKLKLARSLNLCADMLDKLKATQCAHHVWRLIEKRQEAELEIQAKIANEPKEGTYINQMEKRIIESWKEAGLDEKAKIDIKPKKTIKPEIKPTVNPFAKGGENWNS